MNNTKVKQINNKIHYSTKLLFSFLVLGIILQIAVFFIFHYINIKSEQMMNHRTTLKYELKNIQFNLAESHLWIHQFLNKNRDNNKETMLLKAYQNIDLSFNNIQNMIQKKHTINKSPLNNNIYLKSTLSQLHTQYTQLKTTTLKYLSTNQTHLIFNDLQYNSDYLGLIEEFNALLINMEDHFIKVQKEFQEQKQNFYLLMFIIMLFTIIAIFLLIRCNKRKYLDEKHKDTLLQKQTKLADMGQMIDSIAHQWKGPLNIISMRVQMLELDIADKVLSEEKVITTIDKVQYQIQHLLETMNEFRKFFKPDSKKVKVSLYTISESILVLLHDELIKSTINISINCEQDYNIFINQNELKHVLINLILNSKDAFLSNQIDPSDRKIRIIITPDNNKVLLTIEDNAGGIPQNIINKIFDQRFTTKSDIGGTGIGLYLSKQILEKNDATIDVKSSGQNTSFTITFQQDRTGKPSE